MALWRRTRQWHPQNPCSDPLDTLLWLLAWAALPVGLLSGWGHFAGGGALVLILIGLPWLLLGTKTLVVVPVIWAVAGALWRGSLRVGIHTDQLGLTEHYPFGVRRRMRWRDVTGVRLSRECAIVRAGRYRRVRLAPPLAHWAMLAARAQQAALANTGAPPASATPDDRVIWLPGCVMPTVDCAHVRPTGFTGFVCAEWLLVEMAFLLVLCFPVLLLPVLLYALRSLRAERLTGRLEQGLLELRTTQRGLDVRDAGGWRRIPWAAVVTLWHTERLGADYWLVSTTSGDLWLSQRVVDMQALASAVERVVFEREQRGAPGAWAPPVPEAALSRAELAGSADRGLSRPVAG
ncbi:MAG: hypothetical protein HZB16_05005 [Armatimonadetes bacterium]|nr:hypothetical protein [Armatimonadota bacterium]